MKTTMQSPANPLAAIKPLAERQGRLERISSHLLNVFGLAFLVIPLGALVAGKMFSLSDGWVVFCMIGGTVLAFFVWAVATLVHGRRKIVREELVFEEAKQDARPFCLLLRSFSDCALGYGLPFTQLGDKGQRQYQGPIHFQALADGLGEAGRLLVLCREPIDDSRLRSHHFSHIGLRAPDERWIELFRYAAERARSIVLVPGMSPGLLEEIGFIRSDPALLRKTLVFMPPTPPEKVGGTFYFERDRHELEWGKVQAAWASSGLELPNYTVQGMIYIPRADFSIDRHVSELALSAPAGLKEVVEAIAPSAATACTTGDIIATALSRGARRLETSKSDAQESKGIALGIVFVGVAMAIGWSLYVYLNS
jgi:hypothetical protein